MGATAAICAQHGAQLGGCGRPCAIERRPATLRAQVLVLQLQALLRMASISLEGARGGDGRRGVVGDDAQDIDRRPRDSGARTKTPSTPSSSPRDDERQPGEAGDPLGAHPLGVADLGIVRGVGDQHRRARGRHGADLERADGDAPEGAVEAAWATAARRRAARAALATRCRQRARSAHTRGVGAGRALVAGLQQPQARQRDVLVLDQPPRAQRQQSSSDRSLRQLQQQLA